MASQEEILRIAKILARSTSSELNEANVALNSAYKRMRRDQVGIRDLLTLPLEELYQEALVKLVILILEKQDDLSPPERRKAFENFMSLITTRFSNGDVDSHENKNSSNQKEEKFYQEQQENIRRQAETKRQEEAHQREEEERRTAFAQAEAKRHKNEAGYSPERGNSADLGTRSPQPSTKPSESTPLFVVFASIAFIIILIVFGTKNEAPAPKAIQQSAISTTILPAPEVEIQTSVVFEPTHSVAAQSANLRSKPNSRSTVITVLKRGDGLKLISNSENFLKVLLPTGEMAFIAKELVIPIEDLSRLLNITPRDYVSNRLQEKRLDLLMHQADFEARKVTFNLVIGDLIMESNSLDKSIEKLQEIQKFDIQADTSASTWFALSANAAMQSKDYESAFWEARAAIEADPSNPEHHVAFGLLNYQLKNYEAVKVVGGLLPKIAPTSTNAWMLFAIANGLTPESNDQLTKSAFVLAIKLSRNSNNTRRYFRELSEKMSELHIRELLNAALLQESENPKVFTDVSRLVKTVQVN